MSYFGPSSRASDPVTTTADSPDMLPLKGYSIDQLSDYIYRQLGAPTWEVELTKQQIADGVQDALRLYSLYCPLTRVGNIMLVRGQYRYLAGIDVDQGIVDVQFVEPNPVPTEIFYGNLINPAPLFRLGLDEYDTFLRWRKTWQRVTSVRPDWFYDEAEICLYIHNPIERYQAAVFFYSSYTRTQGLPPVGAQWVQEYALEKSRFLLGDIWSKFSGAIPGPLQNLQLDQQKRDRADQRLRELREQLKAMQKSAPIMID
jgi:hypothetical protein